LEPSYIGIALQSAITVYGSWANYVHAGLGLTAGDIATVRHTYVT
jgi:hypothetical protein